MARWMCGQVQGMPDRSGRGSFRRGLGYLPRPCPTLMLSLSRSLALSATRLFNSSRSSACASRIDQSPRLGRHTCLLTPPRRGGVACTVCRRARMWWPPSFSDQGRPGVSPHLGGEGSVNSTAG